MKIDSSFFYWTFYRPLYLLAIKLFHFLPIKRKKIVFIQGDGNGYGCNLKYIAEEILAQKLDYEMVWLVNDIQSPIPSPIKKVRFNRIRAVYELSTAHFIINNLKSRISVKKKHSQFFIYIPHGQSGAKRTEAHSESLPMTYKRVSMAHSQLMDAFVTASAYQTDDVRRYYWCDCDVWELGFPRNDLFFQSDPKLVEHIKELQRIPLKKRVLFYTPTFRDNGDDTAFAININQTLNTLEKKFGGAWVAMVTLHPNFKWYQKPTFDFSERIINVSGYPDMQELLLISDVLITDYSSTMMDFCLTLKPVFRFATDVEQYRGMRGLKDLYFQMPFPLCKTNENLQSAILNFDVVKYKETLQTFLKEYGTLDDGHAAKRFVLKLQTIK